MSRKQSRGKSATETFETFLEERPSLTPELFINRELSWLEFNRRVLEEAAEKRLPLLARTRFAAIFAANLDEFFMIRVAGVKRKVVAGIGDRGPDGRTPVQQLREIHKVTQDLLAEHSRLVHQELLPRLASKGMMTSRKTARRHFARSLSARSFRSSRRRQSIADADSRMFPTIASTLLRCCVVKTDLGLRA